MGKISVGFHSGSISEKMQLQELKISVVAKFLPSGWKALRMRQGNFLINFILSPDGKRFDNLEDAQDHYDKKELKKEMILKQLIESQKASLALSEAAKFKRKFKAEKSPWRNMLKITLEKNHVKNVTRYSQTTKYHKYLVQRKRDLKRVSNGF